MPLEIKPHTVPHLKGLNSGLEPSTKHGYGSYYKNPMFSLKVLILLRKEANERFVLLLAAHIHLGLAKHC